MRKLVYGLAAASAIAIATPALAQVEFFAGPGGAGVEFGAPYHHYYGRHSYRWDHGRYGWRHHHDYYRYGHRDWW
jgi:hypothetical protein